MRLSSSFTPPASLRAPAYNRTAAIAGHLHFGVGAFHRAHQAVYADDALNAGDDAAAIIGIAMRSRQVLEAVNQQDGLFTVTERTGPDWSTRLIGSLKTVLSAAEDPHGVAAAAAAPAVRVVTLTLTEKGYQKDPAGRPPAVCAILAETFSLRKEKGRSGLTLISCDNLAENGTKLRTLISTYLEAHRPDLASWFERECACPNSMVDRIVPAPTERDLEAAAARLGVRDEGAVLTEPFRQWVVESRFAGPRPRWDAGGAQFVDDVRPFETAKLRMLNGAHSALAYLGLNRGYAFVHEAIADPDLMALTRTLMLHEAAASFEPAQGQDLHAYAESLIARFKNVALEHRLSQIAADGSQKAPQRWFATLSARQAAGAACPALVAAVAAWMKHLRGDNGPITDPRGDELAAILTKAGAHDAARAFFGDGGVFAGDWRAAPEALDTITGALLR